MVARRPSKHLRPPRPLRSGFQVGVDKRAGRFIVRTVSGSSATKAYRCPGCSKAIPAGTPHVVAWPAEPGLLSDSPVAERRHWHTGCWQRQR